MALSFRGEKRIQTFDFHKPFTYVTRNKIIKRYEKYNIKKVFQKYIVRKWFIWNAHIILKKWLI